MSGSGWASGRLGGWGLLVRDTVLTSLKIWVYIEESCSLSGEVLASIRTAKGRVVGGVGPPPTMQ